MDEEFQILLGAKFDEKEIQSQLNKLTNFSINVDTIKVNRQAINDLEKNNRISLKLEVDNTANVQKQIQQAAQNAQKSFGNVNVKDFLDNQTKKLMDSYGVSGEAAFKRIRKAVDDCFADIQKFGNTTHKIFDDALGIERTVSLFDGVSESLRDNIKIANEAQGALAQFYNYVKATNNSGYKVHIPNSVRQEFGEEWKSVRATMGAAFTTKEGNYQDIENYFAELNSVLGENFIDLSRGVEAATQQFVSKLVEARHGLKFLSGDDLPNEYKQVADMLTKSVAEEMLAFSQNLSQIENSETRSADIVVESEKRKQQAMAETADVAKQTSQTVVDSSNYNDSVAVSKRKNKDVSNLAYSQYNSDGTYNQDAANQAHAKIKELLEDEEALIATTQRLDSTGNLQSFSTNIKHANGLVETLNFSLKEVEDTNEKIFMFNSATLNDSGAIKLFEQRQKALEQYQNKYREFLSKNSSAELNTTGIDKAFESFKQGSISINELKSSWSSFISETQKGINRLKSQKTSLDPVQQASNNMRDMPTRIEGITRRMEELADKSNLAGVSTEEFAQRYERLKADIQANGGKIPLTEEWSRGFQSLNSDIASVETRLKELESQQQKLANFKTNQLPQIQNNLNYGVYTDQVNQQVEKYERLGVELPEVKAAVDAMAVAEQNLNAVMANTNSTTEQQKAAFDKFQAASKTAAQKTSKAGAMYMSGDQIQTLTAQLEAFRQKNTAMTSEAKAKIAEWISALQGVAPVYASTGRKIRAELKTLENQQRGLGKLGLSPFDTIKQGMQKFSYWTSATYIVMQTVMAVKDAINTVHELDTALVDLRKTTTMSSSQLQEFYYTANDTAKQMGVTTKEIITQAAAWSRLGYQSQEAVTKMAKYSSMFKAISPDMNTEQATDGLVSIMKAFDIGNDNPDDVLDGILSKVNKIGNTAATSNGEIVNMLQKSSSAMKEANNTLEETIALETAAVEITRDDDSVGTAFKTLAMRIRGYDEEGELLDSSEYEQLKGAIADLTKTAKSPGGISLFTDADKTTFKSTYQLLKDISEIYSDLDDKTQAQLLEKLAGKRQGQILAATINNFKAAEKAMDDMANSAGSAEAEMAVIMDSVDYKANKLKETGTGIAQNLFDRGDMKAVLDFLTSLASILDGITGKLGLFGTVGLGAGIFAGIKNFGSAQVCVHF